MQLGESRAGGDAEGLPSPGLLSAPAGASGIPPFRRISAALLPPPDKDMTHLPKIRDRDTSLPCPSSPLPVPALLSCPACPAYSCSAFALTILALPAPAQPCSAFLCPVLALSLSLYCLFVSFALPCLPLSPHQPTKLPSSLWPLPCPRSSGDSSRWIWGESGMDKQQSSPSHQTFGGRRRLSRGSDLSPSPVKRHLSVCIPEEFSSKQAPSSS